MYWSGKAIVLSSRKFDEYGAIIKVLSEEHGLYSGVARHARSSRQRGIFEPGNVIEVKWRARLSEHLGTIQGELVTPVAAMVMQDALLLAALQSAINLLESTLSEREPVPMLYDVLQDVALRLMAGHDWEFAYVKLEAALLNQLGFALDLTHCASTGETEGLCYVSPKSGRAVSANAGEPYRDKLFRLPPFMQQTHTHGHVAPQDVLDGLIITGYFLSLRAFQAQGRVIPPARNHFATLLANRAALPTG